jgi:hypothetical protein
MLPTNKDEIIKQLIQYSANSILAIFRTRTDSIMFIIQLEKRAECINMPLEKYGDLGRGYNAVALL